MQSVIRRSRPGLASATGLLIALTIFGVLLMHSVTPPASVGAGHAVAGHAVAGHAGMEPATHHESSMQVATGDHDCPSAHQMMHPCAGTTASWPALSMPEATFDVAGLSLSRGGAVVGTEPNWERAPPWTLWELDRSVTLRV